MLPWSNIQYQMNLPVQNVYLNGKSNDMINKKSQTVSAFYSSHMYGAIRQKWNSRNYKIWLY